MPARLGSRKFEKKKKKKKKKPLSSIFLTNQSQGGSVDTLHDSFAL